LGHVDHDHTDAAGGASLRNAVAHGAGADDADGLNAAHVHNAPVHPLGKARVGTRHGGSTACATLPVIVRERLTGP
jgi:hypothetical protein